MDQSPISPTPPPSNHILDSMLGSHNKSPTASVQNKLKQHIEISDLSRLLELANAETYTEAAFHIGISESHLRRTISNLNKSVGFILVEKLPGESLMLTSKAKSWLQSFGEFHRSLSRLSECMNNIQSVNNNLEVGIIPCIAFTQTLWQYLADRHAEFDFNCHAGSSLDSLIKKEIDGLISPQQIDNEEFNHQLLYKEPLLYYHLKDQPWSPTDSHVNVILQSPIPADPASIQTLSELALFPEQKINYIEVANTCEALQLVRAGKGIYPSLLLNPKIIPPEITATPFEKEINISIYLITSIYNDFDFSPQVASKTTKNINQDSNPSTEPNV
ncbi:MAG: hypothetical protein ACSHX6_07155 [Akkermansiaceae bacterium]